MFRVASFLGLGILSLALVVSTGSSQDKDKDKKEDPTKVKGQLPAGWKSLNLSKDQVLKVYAVQSKFKSKIAALEDQIKELKVHERSEMVKMLTAEQKETLRKITVGEDEPKKEKSTKDTKDKEK